MSANLFWFGAAVSVLGLTGLIFFLVVWESFSGSRVTSSSVSVQQTLKSATFPWQKTFLTLVALLGCLVLALLFGDRLLSGVTSFSWNLKVFTWVALILLAIYSIGFGKGGAIGKLAAAILMVYALYQVFWPIYLDSHYGAENVRAVIQAQQRRNTEMAILGKPQETPGTSVSRQSQLRVFHRQAVWNGSTGDSLPVGAWSEWAEIGVGCSVDFSFAQGIHRIQYRFYSKGVLEYVPGTSPNMSSFRYMILKEGLDEVPFTVTCR